MWSRFQRRQEKVIRLWSWPELGGVSRARMTRIMSLRNLAPVIQERILGLPAVSATADVLNEHVLRGVAQRWDWREQMRMWKQLEGTLGKEVRRIQLRSSAGRHLAIHANSITGTVIS